MIERAIGIVLRMHLMSETSVIVHWLTRECGRIATVAKGARRKGSGFSGKLDLLFECELAFSRSRKGNLHNLTEVKLSDAHEPLRRDYHLLARAAYGVRLIEQTTEEETPVEELFDLFCGWIAALPVFGEGTDGVLAFEVKMLDWLGLRPDPEQTSLSAEGRRRIEFWRIADWGEIASQIGQAAEGRELNRFLHGFLIYHLGKLPRGRSEALRVG